MALIGAICGDIVGSIYEWDNIKTKEFDLFQKGMNFTDDTVMTIAVADWAINGGQVEDYLVKYGKMYSLPKGGYGGRFRQWLFDDKERKPYDSYGNGSAMRVASIGWLYDTLEETLDMAKKSAECTHNHIEGIKGAQATAAAIFKLRQGTSKEELKEYITNTFEYNLNRTVDEIRPKYKFDVSCQGTVPEAIICFLESTSFEDAIRNAISLGGDSDTLACICGAIAEAYYEIPFNIRKNVLDIIPQNFITIVECVETLYNNKKVTSGTTAMLSSLQQEVKDLCEVRYDKPIIPICVDFDGTIVTHEYPKIGKANPHAIEIMKELTEEYNVGWILDTMRSNYVLQEAVDYLSKNGIKLYGIGENPTQKRWTNSTKAYAPFSIDDRNIGTPLLYKENTRPYVDWLKIKEIIKPILDGMVGKVRKDNKA